MIRFAPDGGRDDDELLRAVRAGERAAMAELYLRHAGFVRRYARRFVRTPEAADDLVAEAFANVLRVLTTGGGPARHFRAYLVAAVRNAAYDRTRREREHPTAMLDDVLAGVLADLAAVDPHQSVGDAMLVAGALASLPPRWRHVLWLTAVDGLAAREVADRLGISANAAAALAYRARTALRAAVGAADGAG